MKYSLILFQCRAQCSRHTWQDFNFFFHLIVLTYFFHKRQILTNIFAKTGSLILDERNTQAIMNITLLREAFKIEKKSVKFFTLFYGGWGEECQNQKCEKFHIFFPILKASLIFTILYCLSPWEVMRNIICICNNFHTLQITNRSG